ncbi:MAG: hypothetical protein ACXWE7_11815, partial [Nitrososphaeraceae archaeon]
QLGQFFRWIHFYFINNTIYIHIVLIKINLIYLKMENELNQILLKIDETRNMIISFMQKYNKPMSPRKLQHVTFADNIGLPLNNPPIQVATSPSRFIQSNNQQQFSLLPNNLSFVNNISPQSMYIGRTGVFTYLPTGDKFNFKVQSVNIQPNNDNPKLFLTVENKILNKYPSFSRKLQNNNGTQVEEVLYFVAGRWLSNQNVNGIEIKNFTNVENNDFLKNYVFQFN